MIIRPFKAKFRHGFSVDKRHGDYIVMCSGWFVADCKDDVNAALLMAARLSNGMSARTKHDTEDDHDQTQETKRDRAANEPRIHREG